MNPPPDLTVNRTASVLVVEDNPLLLLVLSELVGSTAPLTLAGAAADALTALQLSTETRLDAAICDIHLPDMSGLDLIPRLRAHHPELVVITYSSAQVDPTVLAEVGVDRSFDKVHLPSDVVNALARQLDIG
jgi:CheY-like chemotaxis protein